MSEHRLDRIYIRDLMVRCIVGINDEERVNKQDVVVNIILQADLHTPGTTDRIEDTIDYKAVKKRILALVESSSFFLIERLAQAIADACLEEAGVESVRVAIDKPGALRFARSVAVEIARNRPTA